MQENVLKKRKKETLFSWILISKFLNFVAFQVYNNKTIASITIKTYDII
jgi:hypothetical protein